MAITVQAQTVPKGSFLTRFCAENPTDTFCVKVATVKAKVIADAKTKNEPASGRTQGLGTYRMIRAGNLRSSPNTANRANIIGKLNAGQRFIPRRRFGNAGITWYEIELPNGKKAYVSTGLAKKIR